MRAVGLTILGPMRASARRLPIVATLAVALFAPGSDGALAADLPPRFPAAGELLGAVAVRAEPRPSARIVRRLRRFRPDHQFQVVLALSSRRGADGAACGSAQPARTAERRARLDQGGCRRAAAGRQPDRRPPGSPAARGAARSATAACSCGASPRSAPSAPRRRGAVTSTCSPRSCRPIRSTGRSRSRRPPTRESATGRQTSSGSTARTCPRSLGQAVSHGCVRVSNDVVSSAPAARAARHPDRHPALTRDLRRLSA